MREVKIFTGKEITDEKIAKIREITKKRYPQPVYDSTYWGIENVEQLAYLHDINVEDEILILGKDWFLCYIVSGNTVEFLEWVSLKESETKFIQSIEMMNALRGIFMQHSDKIFSASMRHNGSYPFYLKMLQRKYFKENSHTVDIDFCNGFAPERLKYLEEDYISLGNFLISEEFQNHPEYLTYILHCLTFNVIDMFVEQCKKLAKKL